MIIPAETIKLKDMKEYLLRSTEESDAEQLASFIYELHTECPYMVNTLDEIETDPAPYEAIIRSFRESDHGFHITVYDGEKLIAAAGVEPVGFERKVMHRCTIGIAINKSYRNKGLGTQMIALCMDLAGALGYNVMEMGVNSKNTLALSVLNRTGCRNLGYIPRDTVKPRDLYGALLLTGFLCTYTDKIINLLNLCIYTILVNGIQDTVYQIPVVILAGSLIQHKKHPGWMLIN